MKGALSSWIDRHPYTFLIVYTLSLHALLIAGVVGWNLLSKG